MPVELGDYVHPFAAKRCPIGFRGWRCRSFTFVVACRCNNADFSHVRVYCMTWAPTFVEILSAKKNNSDHSGPLTSSLSQRLCHSLLRRLDRTRRRRSVRPTQSLCRNRSLRRTAHKRFHRRSNSRHREELSKWRSGWTCRLRSGDLEDFQRRPLQPPPGPWHPMAVFLVTRSSFFTWATAGIKPLNKK